MESWQDLDVGTDFTTNSSATPVSWYLNGANGVYYVGDVVSIRLVNVRNMLDASNWTPVAPVPLPAGVWLLLSALGGLGFAGWRRKRTVAA